MLNIFAHLLASNAQIEIHQLLLDLAGQDRESLLKVGSGSLGGGADVLETGKVSVQVDQIGLNATDNLLHGGKLKK